ncbi:MAG: shikimate kinase [Negativicutes bacterium]|nr:shikimate kinase [Negativicutes bacterium]
MVKLTVMANQKFVRKPIGMPYLAGALQQLAANERKAMNNIILIGFMGTGKTTTGKILASRLNRKFIDVDEEIELACGMSVNEIFSVHGEPFFREQEKYAIERVMKHSNAVIATGGGAVLAADNVANLKRDSMIIALQAAPEVILRRLEQCNIPRPLLNKPDRLQVIVKMLADRAPKYQIADLYVDTNTRTPWEVSQIIIDNLRLREKAHRKVSAHS